MKYILAIGAVFSALCLMIVGFRGLADCIERNETKLELWAEGLLLNYEVVISKDDLLGQQFTTIRIHRRIK